MLPSHALCHAKPHALLLPRGNPCAVPCKALCSAPASWQFVCCAIQGPILCSISYTALAALGKACHGVRFPLVHMWGTKVIAMCCLCSSFSQVVVA